MVYDTIPYEVAPMRVSDISEIMTIEQQSFSTPWAPSAYSYELRHNAHAHYYVVRRRNSDRQANSVRLTGWHARLRRLLRWEKPTAPSILGYVGFWLVAGEAHISTIAVHPDVRRRGLGELLLAHVIEAAAEHDAEFITLEVRVSNLAAQHLYEKYGFEREGRRKGYYSDNREDAWIMTADRFNDPEFWALFERNRRALRERLLQAQVDQ